MVGQPGAVLATPPGAAQRLAEGLAAAGVLERLVALARDHDEIRSVSVMVSGDRAPRGTAAPAGRTKLASRAIGVLGHTCRRAEGAKIRPVTGAWRRDAGYSQVLEPKRPELGT